MTPEPGPLAVELELDPRINVALQQNAVPVVKRLRLTNGGDTATGEVDVRLTAEPEFAAPWSRRVASLPPGAERWLDDVDLGLRPEFLDGLTERVSGLLWVEVGRDGVTLARRSWPVELLARDEWSGLRSLPEILAAFVLPNHPAVADLLGRAARRLGEGGGDPGLSGYQSRDPERVRAMVAAVYGALSELDLTYVSPPASFEREGQRVRLPGQVRDGRMGTCLDLALLAAGCLEQCGLHPLVVLLRSHAVTGVWLREESFATAVVEEGSLVRNRVGLGHLAVFDPTGLTPRPPLDFAAAVAEARRRIETDFECAIDVRRARIGGIRPLPERLAVAPPPPGGADPGRPPVPPAAAAPAGPPGPAGGEPASGRRAPGRDRDAAAPAGPPGPAGGEPASGRRVPGRDRDAAETPAARLDRWRRRLLDLSLRNRLLNLRETKRSVPVLGHDLRALEDALAGGRRLRLLPRPADLGPGDPRDPDLRRRRTGEDAVRVLLAEALEQRRLHADLAPEELDRRVLEVYRAARLGLEEGGASTLYLALGLLAWTETPTSPERRLAPVLLVPVQLHRRSARDPFELALAEDDVRVNVTLLEMLRQDFHLTVAGVDPLPEDARGVDVGRVLNAIREAVRDYPRWEVLEAAHLGLFSFAKFLMWRDLAARTGDLLRNRLVDHLVHRPYEAFDPEGAFPRAEELDARRAPGETFCPLPADGSQLAAVFAAADGRTFVLEGPPGTGKSQTIANLVAQCLVAGKTVLFVSEKMAALEVVEERLRRVGLGTSCLELHSRAAHKRGVLDQLRAALEATGQREPAEWAEEAERVARLRGDLNGYVTALHRVHPNGGTVFQATAELVRLREVPPVALAWPGPDSLDAAGLRAARELVEQAEVASRACGGLRGHVWAAARRAEWSPAWEREVAAAVGRLGRAAGQAEAAAGRCAAPLGLPAGGWSLDALAAMDGVAEGLLGEVRPPASLLVPPGWPETERHLATWIAEGRRRDAMRAEVHATHTPALLQLDLDDLDRRLRAAAGAWGPLAWLRRGPVRRALRRVRRPDAAAPVAGAPAALAAAVAGARALRAQETRLAAAGDAARALLGAAWRDGEAAWDDVEALRDVAARLRELAAHLGRGPDGAAALRGRWAAALGGQEAEGLGPGGPVRAALADLRAALGELAAARDAVTRLLDLDPAAAWGEAGVAGGLARVRTASQAWEAGRPALRAWCAWRRVRADAEAAGLGPLLEGLETGRVEADALGPVFERSYWDWWLGEAIEGEPVLRGFSSPEHERRIARFRAADRAYTELTGRLVAARLAQRVPRADAAPATSEMGILQREINKRSRHLPVRQLLQRIPNLLPRLTPCLLMSPMSVAQYLDAAFPPFDLVVFDEASQIPVWDAVGAIARGRQTVVVGDPRQLPPTTFFQRADEEGDASADDAGDQVEDLESILDDCLGARVPALRLHWHYRSRHESLIAFSNARYYEHRLLTFPSPQREGMGVTSRPVPDGVYDRSRSRTNRREAEAVAAEIVRRLGDRLRDPGRAGPSLGVVTFNLAQQALVEDLLEEARRADPALEPFFAEAAVEPVFVKNLENVQGDERDVILFSVAYGPDASGRVSMNFGPINQMGGERRLNVAITRARREVLVFSTLRADQVDLARTAARGARDLKAFLEYAERGPAALAGVRAPEGGRAESPLEAALHDALAARGWTVHRQVGCSGYRIDLAVVDPARPDRYLLGVEGDGANYHRAATARDRDRLRAEVLEGLGWTLHRAWSSDWWADPVREVERIEAALARAGQAPAAPAAPDPLVAPPAPGPGPPGAPAPERYQPYRPARGEGPGLDLLDPAAASRVREALGRIVAAEGPIRLDLAARRLVEAAGGGRTTAAVVGRVRELAAGAGLRLTESPAGAFLWPPGLVPEAYRGFRVPGDDPEATRDAEDLPPEEVANAALAVLEGALALPAEALARETSRLLGFQRLGRVVEERVRLGMDLLVASGRAVADAERIRLPRP